MNHVKAISAGLKALKLLGVDGVDVPVWWGVVEKENRGEYDWTSYLELAQMIQDAGLKIHVSLYFHASKFPGIPLPTWVSSIGDSDANIYFADKQGNRNKECLSLGVDNLPVLAGKTPLQVYGDFCKNFQTTFAAFMSNNTITVIEVSFQFSLFPSFQDFSSMIPSLRFVFIFAGCVDWVRTRRRAPVPIYASEENRRWWSW